MSRKSLRVEVAFPFCPNTCQYCAMPSDYERAMLMGAYCDALETELAQSAADMDDYTVDAVYLGGNGCDGFCGGIASYIRAERVCALLDRLRASFDVAEGAEVVLRALLGYVNEFKLREYREAGVTAVEVDYHTCGTDRSRFTGRLVWPEQERTTVRAFRHYGMEDVGYQVLYGLPGETVEEWGRELEGVLALGPSHLELRAFSPAGTRSEVELSNLTRVHGARSEWHTADASEQDAMRAAAAKLLGDAGFAEYLPGCYALPGHERRYLRERASGGDCLALGAGAVSRIDGVCSRNVAGVDAYVKTGGDVTKTIEKAWEAQKA